MYISMYGKVPENIDPVGFYNLRSLFSSSTNTTTTVVHCVISLQVFFCDLKQNIF